MEHGASCMEQHMYGAALLQERNEDFTHIDCHYLGLDPPHLCGANRNLAKMLSPGRRAYQHYQNLAPRRASGQ